MFSKFHTFTFFPTLYWSHTFERQQELIYRFAQVIKRKIQIIQPLGLVKYPVLSKETIAKIFTKIKSSKSRYNNERILDNMTFVKFVYLHRFDNFSTKFNIAQLNRKLDLSKNNFFWASYINPVIYPVFKNSMFKIIDLAERRQANPQLSAAMKVLERRAVSEADLVVVDNLATFEDYKAATLNIHYLPQGYDHTIFKKPQNSQRNKIGYIGNLHNAIDYGYLFDLIELNQDKTFLFVGGILDPSAKQLSKYGNVEMVGLVPKDQLQKYLDQMIFGLIPYKKNEFTRGVFPTKLFEYLGAYVPVISTGIPEVLKYENDRFIFILDKPRHIELKPNLEGLETFLKSNTWDDRFEEYLSHIKHRCDSLI
jgi:glycosyltransferase involved in cell wall biosynthesis